MRVLTFLVCSFAYSQEFEAASIRASEPLRGGAVRIGPPTGGPGTNDPTHFTWPNATLQGMLQRAYDVKAYQVSAPDWIRTERYDLALALPEGTTKERFAAMWRNLLATRFGVKVRIEKKEFSVDELVVGPRGHKLKESANPSAAPFSFENGSPLGKDGRLNGAGIVIRMKSDEKGLTTAEAFAAATTMTALADLLSGQVGHPVLDKTGLTGKYDFTVEYSPAPPPGAGPATPAPALADAIDLTAAVQQQLGLRLEKGKGMLDYVVVENAEKVPTEN